MSFASQHPTFQVLGANHVSNLGLKGLTPHIMIDCLIVSGLNGQYSFQFYPVVLHELGHCLGFTHARCAAVLQWCIGAAVLWCSSASVVLRCTSALSASAALVSLK